MCSTPYGNQRKITSRLAAGANQPGRAQRLTAIRGKSLGNVSSSVSPPDSAQRLTAIRGKSPLSPPSSSSIRSCAQRLTAIRGKSLGALAFLRCELPVLNALRQSEENHEDGQLAKLISLLVLNALRQSEENHLAVPTVTLYWLCAQRLTAIRGKSLLAICAVAGRRIVLNALRQSEENHY